MVSTRSSSRRQQQQDGEGDNDSSTKTAPKNEKENVTFVSEPKPISSSDEEEESSSSSVASLSTNEEQTTTNAASAAPPRRQPRRGGESRLYAPFNSLGIVSDGTPYCLTHTGDSSKTSFLHLPIGNRFQIYQCDKLSSVLVSRVCRGNISNIQADASLSITVCGHSKHHLTLYHRTRPVHQNMRVASKHYTIVDMLHLGRIQVQMSGEKSGKQENVAVMGVVLKKLVEEKHEDGVEIVGDHDDEEDDTLSDEDSEDDDDILSSSSGDEDDMADCSGEVVIVLASRSSLSIQNRIHLSSTNFGTPTVSLHPSTYLNKILVGSSNGMLLLNVRTSKIIYNFVSLKDQHISALEQSPAIDTVAVGTNFGKVHLINLKHDLVLFSLDHPCNEITSLAFRTDGSAMRYGIAPLAVGRSDGTISVWDLQPNSDNNNERTLLTELQHVHQPGGISKLSFLPQEPLLVSTGTQSNSVKMHVFDSPDFSGRLLRQRCGHTAPPSVIKYKYSSTNSGMLNQSLMDGSDAAAFQILSGGSADGTLREFSSVRPALDKEYSQGKGLVKKSKQLSIKMQELLLPPIVDLVTCQARSREWGDLVTIHHNCSFAYVWSTQRGAQSGPLLKQTSWNVSAMQLLPPPSTHATSVCLSACGNFCLVGTKGGIIYKYNVQSGIPRGQYPYEEEVAEKKKPIAGDVRRTMQKLEKSAQLSNRSANVEQTQLDKAMQQKAVALQQERLKKASHTGHAVTGLAVDALNKTLLSVGSDAKLILWNFSTRAPHKSSPFRLPSHATKLCHLRDTNMAAIALEDYSILLFDCTSLRIVRRFGVANDARHSGPISGLDLTPDGRTLVSGSLDGTVRVWDVPTSSCVDWLAFQSPPTCLTLSGTGEFLATTHQGQLGISLWSDKSFYQSVQIVNGDAPAEPARMDEPIPIAQENSNDEEDYDNRREVTATLQDADSHVITKGKATKTQKQVASPPKTEGLVTLSGLPPSHWKNLFHLELVKERNKPKEPPKKPPSAPFFLQMRGNVLQDSSSNIKPTAANEDDEWAAAWSDEDDQQKKARTGEEIQQVEAAKEAKPKKRGLEESNAGGAEADRDGPALDTTKQQDERIVAKPKKRKVTHARSHLASLLQECHGRASASGLRFQAVTEHMATLGPSAIDVAFSTLCNGMHDLQEGLPLLHLTAQWLLEACQSRQRYEAVNAYLHRFLYLHSNTIAGIDDSIKEETEVTSEEEAEKEQERQERLRLMETIAELRVAQRSASDALRAKMQHSLCLLRHFSRMV